ncbi:glutamine--fructose-6-phosphate transaminase (isomerizing) [Halostella litorea]|uniref:glutamine--fructose-6-phosphate transaminase (isomerizing) n=1 Tax=Halostella litorea TaxID=2528831 RepID=UPI0010924DC5|nr:glutamine--fructose-6-phosphate transaminase (isomerizing) [Halostella litorea]
MCGITAHVGGDEAVEDLLVGLENLEYRGYDSAGVAVKNGHGIDVCKRQGEISQLKDRIRGELSGGHVGIGHTRWSTHGPPTDENAHPHTDCTGEVAVVHNGIIENYGELKRGLERAGHGFDSDTDTEVVPHLVEEYRDEGLSPEAAFRRTIRRLEGSYAVAMVVDGSDAVYATRNGSPLVMGVSGDRRFLASDAPAFLTFTDRVVYLEDGDVVAVEPGGHRITDLDGNPVERPPETVDWVAEDAEKGGYDHYMLKEIHEQPAALAQTLQGRIDGQSASDDAASSGVGRDAVSLTEFPPGSFGNVEEVQFVACGTSYHAALYATRVLASRGIHASAYRAGEYATSPAPIGDGSLVVGVTQSGETADTLESLRVATRRGARTLAVTNVVGSTAARECDDALFIRAGPEIGVAATKTFSSQVATLTLLGERIVRDVTGLASDEVGDLLDSLAALGDDVRRVVDGSGAEDVADRYVGRPSYFFIGRDVGYPVALEGALKFKEITYEHAEGFAAGELKHGPLALVTEETPVFAVFTGRHDEKTLSNVEQVQARGAPVIAVASEDHDAALDVADEALTYPAAAPEAAAVLANVQLQLVAYHVANRLDRAIDKPRNLAKSVTVE